MMDEFMDAQDDYSAWEQAQIDQDEYLERMTDFYDQQKEANLVSWGSECLDEVNHDW